MPSPTRVQLVDAEHWARNGALRVGTLLSDTSGGHCLVQWDRLPGPRRELVVNIEPYSMLVRRRPGDERRGLSCPQTFRAACNLEAYFSTSRGLKALTLKAIELQDMLPKTDDDGEPVAEELQARLRDLRRHIEVAVRSIGGGST